MGRPPSEMVPKPPVTPLATLSCDLVGAGEASAVEGAEDLVTRSERAVIARLGPCEDVGEVVEGDRAGDGVVDGDLLEDLTRRTPEGSSPELYWVTVSRASVM